MVGGFGPQQTVRIAAVGFLATILAGMALRTRRGGAPAPVATAAPAPVEAGWRLRDDRLLWSSAWGLTCVLAAMSAVNVVLVFFIIRSLGSTERVYGIVDSMWTVGVLIGAWAFSRAVRPATADATIARRVFGALGVLALAVLLIGTVPGALWIVPIYLVGGAQNGGLNVLVGTLMGRRVPAPARGRAAAALAMRVQAGAMTGYLAGGLLLEVASPRAIVLGCGALGLATVLAVLPFVLRAATPRDLGLQIAR